MRESRAFYAQYLLVSLIAVILSVLVASASETYFSTDFLSYFKVTGNVFLTSVAAGFVGAVASLVIHRYASKRVSVGVRLAFVGALMPVLLITTVVIGQVFISALALGNEGTILSVFLILGSVYFTTFFSIMLVADAVSRQVKNVFFLAYASMFGGLAAVILPMMALLVIVGTASTFELFLIFDRGYYRAHRSQLEGGEGELLRFSYSTKKMRVGLGDFVFYSMLPASALVNIGPGASMLVSGLVVSGVVLNLFLLRNRNLVSGLLFPSLLGLLPLVVKLAL